MPKVAGSKGPATIPRALIGCGVALAMLTPDPAPAQSDDATSTRLEALFGEHEAYWEFLLALQAAVAAGDRAAVAAMVAYPLRATIAGEPVTIGAAADFLAPYGRLLTPAVVPAIERQSYAPLFANAEGVMIGDGESWFRGKCADARWTESRARVIAINPEERAD
jgi:hypothetical protein